MAIDQNWQIYFVFVVLSKAFHPASRKVITERLKELSTS